MRVVFVHVCAFLTCDILSLQRNGQGILKSRQEGDYDGSWENDLRHGFGKQKYPNGDYYEGGWELNRVRGESHISFNLNDFVCIIVVPTPVVLYKFMCACSESENTCTGQYFSRIHVRICVSVIDCIVQMYT